MAGGIFSRIFGGGIGNDPLTNCLSAYDKRQKGLTARVVTYVREGDGRPVLSALATSRPQGRQPYNAQNWQVEQNQTNMENSFCHTFGGDPAGLARYVEVLTAARGTKPYRSNYNTDLSDETPDEVANLLQFLSAGNYRAENLAPVDNTNPTTFSDLVKTVKILGGSPADLISMAIPTGYSAANPTLDGVIMTEGIRDFTTEHYIKSLNRRKAGDRAKVMKLLAAYPVAKNPDFLEYLMESACAGSAQVRAAAVRLLGFQSKDAVEERAIPLLDARAVGTRSSAVQILGAIGSDSALAAMKKRAEVEKSQDVLTAINHYAGTSVAAVSDAPDGQYQAADGTLFDIPDYEPLVDDGSAPFGPEDLKALKALDQRQYENSLASYNHHLDRIKAGDKSWGHKPRKPVQSNDAEKMYQTLNSPVDLEAAFPKVVDPKNPRRRHLYFGYHLRPWLLANVSRLPHLRVVHLALLTTGDVRQASTNHYDPICGHLYELILDGTVDLRQVMAIGKMIGLSLTINEYRNTKRLESTPAGFLQMQLSEASSYSVFPDIPATWPIAANGLIDVLSGLPPRTTNVSVNARALKMLSHFPKLPMAAVDAVLYAALDERRRISDPAQALLLDVDGIDERLVTTLTDKRQVVRAKAASFLADRDIKTAVPALVKRLKTEKSESARADMISAVARLGGDTTPYLGRKAIQKEAETLVAKLPNAKIDWLEMATAPPLKWSDGKAVDPSIQDAWLRLALKLKSPTGSPLFGLYYDQLDPHSVTAFCDWVLKSWIAYDIWKPASDELREKAHKQAVADKAAGRGWYGKWTVDQIANYILQSWMTGYPNSGSDAKGILALTHRATPATATVAISGYLKNHGKRVSQAKCLVEVLAAMGTPEALQVLVATATRFKQRTVRELAEKSVGEIAEQRGWTQDELADRSIPSGGFEEDGIMALEVGEEAKPYSARLGSDLSVKLFNPDGKEVKAIPAGKDANTKESKSLLSGAKKTVKTVVGQQTTRLYDAMIGARKWTRNAWEGDLVTHPIMARLIERVIWRGLAEDGSVVVLFRPTPEGDRLTADGDDADMSKIAYVDIAHTATVDEDTRQEWLTHMSDFEVKPLFAQISRPMHLLDKSKAKQTAIEDRKGWLTEAFKLRTATSKAGYDRGPVEDGAGFYLYTKTFRNAETRVELQFTGSYVPEDNIPVAIIDMQFYRTSDRRARRLELGEVPKMVLSEAWNDLHDIASVGAFDDEWRKKGLY